MHNMKSRIFEIVLPLVFFLTPRAPSHPNQVQGNIEREFVYIGSPRAGKLDTLAVSRGSRVEAARLLFALDFDLTQIVDKP
jgi:multidrug efflux pump subunit AcrA (membrane-fusion protein)